VDFLLKLKMINVLIKNIKRCKTELQLKPRIIIIDICLISETILLKKHRNNLNIDCLFKHRKSKINISNLVINGCKTNDNLKYAMD